MTTYRTLLPCLLMLASCAAPLTAQTLYEWQQCDTCFKGYDVNWQQHHQFEIGGEDLALPTQGRRDFTMEFGYFYGMPTSLARYADVLLGKNPPHFSPCTQPQSIRSSRMNNSFHHTATTAANRSATNNQLHQEEPT
ncbi:MAG: hypothetical protein JNJ94_05920 [Chlorobi bacterium]|nr:hypothetical protein [Chlorobiota bacterium]